MSHNHKQYCIVSSVILSYLVYSFTWNYIISRSLYYSISILIMFGNYGLALITYQHISVIQTWIFSCRCKCWISKRADVINLNTWPHGSGHRLNRQWVETFQGSGMTKRKRIIRYSSSCCFLYEHSVTVQLIIRETLLTKHDKCLHKLLMTEQAGK